MRRAETGVHVRAAPDFDRENAKGSQESAGIVNRQHRGDQPPALLKARMASERRGIAASDGTSTSVMRIRGLILAQKKNWGNGFAPARD